VVLGSGYFSVDSGLVWLPSLFSLSLVLRKSNTLKHDPSAAHP
jgi:hypothetical protein